MVGIGPGLQPELELGMEMQAAGREREAERRDCVAAERKAQGEHLRAERNRRHRKTETESDSDAPATEEWWPLRRRKRAEKVPASGGEKDRCEEVQNERKTLKHPESLITVYVQC